MWDDSTYRTPGQLIQDTLERRGWTQRVLAMVLGIDEATINKVITGKKALDATLALQMAEVLEIDAKRLMALQTAYELGQAALVLRPDPSRVNRAHLFGRLPTTEMIKRGWISVQNLTLSISENSHLQLASIQNCRQLFDQYPLANSSCRD